MTKPIIEIKGLGKKYKIGALREPYLSLRDSLARKAKGFVQSISRLTANSSELVAHSSQEDFWALEDINFSVQQGEAVGIIGRNGAGKSTLLKILSQITPPTEGEIICRGRIASLLEVGTGFHPELTGRENIYLNGAILGMTRGEIRSKFDEIVAFAEVEKFLDTPVKRYSSGMYVRLAFAVAAHLEPEILVVDEVLAVGDTQFQKKCLGKMKDVAGQGRTVLFVSHNMAAIQALCVKGVLLEKGRSSLFGGIDKVINSYLAVTTSHSDLANNFQRKSKGIVGLWFENETGEKIQTLITGQSVRLCMAYLTEKSSSAFRFVAVLRGQLDEAITCWDSLCSIGEGLRGAEEGIAVCQIKQLPVLPGNYVLDVSLDCGDVQIEIIRKALLFTVEGGDYFGTGRIPQTRFGAVLVEQRWSVKSGRALLSEKDKTET